MKARAGASAMKHLKCNGNLILLKVIPPLANIFIISVRNFSKNKIRSYGFTVPQYIPTIIGFANLIFEILHCIGQI